MRRLMWITIPKGHVIYPSKGVSVETGDSARDASRACPLRGCPITIPTAARNVIEWTQIDRGFPFPLLTSESHAFTPWTLYAAIGKKRELNEGVE